MTDNLMNVKETAVYLKMNKMTIYKLARQGKIPAFRVASEWRFNKDLINEWLMQQLKGKPGLEKIIVEKFNQTGKTVLVVDDDETIQDYFGRALKGYKVIKASGGEEALNIIKNDSIDLVLLDIRMPGIDGIETLRRIKQYDKNIAIIMLSAYGNIQTSIEAARLGAYSSMAKPFDLHEMKQIITEAIVVSGKGRTAPISLQATEPGRKKKQAKK